MCSKSLFKTGIFLFKTMIVLSPKVIETFHWGLCTQIWSGEGWWNLSYFGWPPGCKTWTSNILFICPMRVKKMPRSWADDQSYRVWASISQKFGHATLKQIIDWIHVFTLSSHFQEGFMFLKISETLREIRKVSESFGWLYIILSRIWGEKYHITDKNIPKMALLDRRHLSKLYKQATDCQNIPKHLECFRKFGKP